MVEVLAISSYFTNLFNQSNSSSKWIVTIGIFLITVYCVLSFRRRKYKLPPGPTGIPFFGYLPFLGKFHHETLVNLAKKYGPVFSLYLGQTRVIFLNNWESVKDAMSKNAALDKPPGIFDILPSGLGFASASGQEWFEQRRFSVKLMKDIGLGRDKWEEMLEEEVQDIVKSIQDLKGKAVDGLQLFASTFTNNILSLLFGERISPGNSASTYISEMVDLCMRQIQPLTLPNFLPRFCQLLSAVGLYESKKNYRKVAEYDKYMRNRIIKRLQHQGDDEDSFVKKYNDGMQNKIKNGESTTLTDLSLYANVETLILGGAETSRTGMLWLLIAVAQNPEVQARVHRELDSVLGKDSTIKWADRSKIPYTFACVLEALRWKSVTPVFLLRMISEDTTIGGYDIPKGTCLSVNSWALHNDPKYWPNPEKYDPSRMLLDGGKTINFRPEGFNAFSQGRRSCPGEMIALMEILVYFSKILQKFDVLPEEGTCVKYDVSIGLTFQPVNFKLRFVPRE